MSRRPVDEAAAVADAVAAAEHAARAVRDATPAERAGWLRAVAESIEADADELVAVAGDETALPDARLRGEVARTTGQLRLFAEVVEEGSWLDVIIDEGDPSSDPPAPDLRRTVRALGPVAVFSAGNFPFAFSVAGGDTASALAAGCPVIVKAHPGHPGLSDATARSVAAALEGAGAPQGTFGLVHGFEAGRALVTAGPVRAVAFTGSPAGGRALFDLAAGRRDPIPFYGELGSINPVVIGRQAADRRATEIVEGLVGSFTLGVGQFCTKPGLVFVPAGTSIATQVAEAVGSVPSATMLSDDMAAAFDAGLSALTQLDGVELVAGDPAGAVRGRAAAPVVVTTTVEHFLTDPDVLTSECFGPVTVLVTYSDLDGLARAVSQVSGSLTMALHAEPDELADYRQVWSLFEDRGGRLIVDGWPTGVAVTWALHHGGPWPATTAPLHTSVGATAIRRFLRPVVYQNVPEELLPPPVRRDNPWQLPRRVDGRMQ
ncbi:MAG: aldehyde dehydrogenase (NADP(+)) [Nitriliruptoraceae bacterium]